MAAIFFQQNIARVVHLEVVQGGPLNTLIPNTCLQQPMSGGPQKRGFAPYRYYKVKVYSITHLIQILLQISVADCTLCNIASVVFKAFFVVAIFK